MKHSLFCITFLISCNFERIQEIGSKKPIVSKSIVQNFGGEVRSGEEGNLVLLGRVGDDSSVRIKMKLKARWGRYYVMKREYGHCRLDEHSRYEKNRQGLPFRADLKGEFARMRLYFDEAPWTLDELIEEAYAKAFWRGGELEVEFSPRFLGGDRGLYIAIASFDKQKIEDRMWTDFKDCELRSFHENFAVKIETTITASIKKENDL